MSPAMKDRHLFGMGAAACAVCCAAPLLTLLGVAGAAATAATFVVAGVVFGLVVAAGALLAVWNQRRQHRREACATDVGPIDVALSPRRSPPAYSPSPEPLAIVGRRSPPEPRE